MSSGGSIPYHLRQNKAIERNLFIDLLQRVGRAKNISDYTYVGFGGPFLEDFKHIHSALRIKRMISIEMDDDVFARQKFNQPISCVKLLRTTASEFLFEHNFDDQSVVWFDYARPADLGEQLNETRTLIEKLPHGSVFKITVNANPQTLGSPKDQQPLHEYRRDRIIARIGDYAPPEVAEEDVYPSNYPSLLMSAIFSAARQGVRGSPEHHVQPLASFVYSDGQQMLTVTGMVLRADERERFLEQTRLEHWPFSDLDGKTPRSISVPSFSVKERLHVESLLPEANANDIISDLKYSIDEDKGAAKELIENFVEFYRLYPWYSRVVM
jgi:hypothetical protein